MNVRTMNLFEKIVWYIDENYTSILQWVLAIMLIAGTAVYFGAPFKVYQDNSVKNSYSSSLNESKFLTDVDKIVYDNLISERLNQQQSTRARALVANNAVIVTGDYNKCAIITTTDNGFVCGVVKS